MSWSGIWLVHVPEGVTVEQAINATLVPMAQDSDDEEQASPAPDPIPVPIDPEWSTKARRALLEVNPNLRPVDDSGDLDDGVGPVWIRIYPDQVQLQPKKRWQGPDDIDGFAVMWEYCISVDRHAGCVAHDPDYDEVFDLSLDTETARSLYNWM